MMLNIMMDYEPMCSYKLLDWINVPESKMYIMRDEVGLMPLFMMFPINDDSSEENHNNNMYRFLPDNTEQEKPIHTKISNLVRGFSANKDAIVDLCSGYTHEDNKYNII